MNPADFAKGLSQGPDFLWQDLDLVNRRGLVVKFEEAGYRAASFLDHRAFKNQTLGAWLNLAEILRNTQELAAPAPQALFHVSHCGSTLVSRLVAELPGCLPVREPLVPLVLAQAKRELRSPSARLDDAGWRTSLEAAYRSLSRVYRAGERVLIKHTSACSNLLPDFLDRDPGSRALLLHADLETWLAVMLRGDGVRGNGRFYAQAWLEDFHVITGRTDLRLAALADAEQFVINWLTGMLHFERATQAQGARVRRLDFEDLLKSPAAELEKLAQLFGLDGSRATAVTSGPLMSSYAKRPNERFDSAARQRELEQSRTRNESEIKAGMAFAEELCKEIAGLAPLGVYFTRSSSRKE